MCLRRVDLAPILAELGRDEVHLERGVYVLLRQRGDLLTTLLGTDAVQPVLVEEKLSAQGQAAQPHVVLLRTGEIEKRRPERPGRHYPQVDLQSTVDDDRALRFASREHALDAGGPGEDLEDRRCVVARDDDVDVADRLLVAAQAPRDRELLDAGLGSQVIGHRRRGRARLMQERSAGALLQRGDRSEDVLFGLRLDLGKLLQPMLLGRFLELLDGRDLQVVVDDPRSRRADARYAQQRQETGRDRCLELRVTLRPAGRDDLLDRLADRRADLRDLLEPALLDQLGERLAKVADRPSGRAVRDRAKDVLTLELEQVADLVEDLRDGVVTDGESVEGHAPMLRRLSRSGGGAGGRGIARELEIRERGLEIAARAELLRVLRGERREIRMVLDRREYFDGLAVRPVGRGEVGTRVCGGRSDPQGIGLLTLVAEIGKPRFGALGKGKRLLRVALFEGDPSAQHVDDGADAKVAGERRTLAATIDRLTRGVHVPMLELDRCERLHYRKLDRGVGHALEEPQ